MFGYEVVTCFFVFSVTSTGLRVGSPPSIGMWGGGRYVVVCCCVWGVLRRSVLLSLWVCGVWLWGAVMIGSVLPWVCELYVWL